MKNAPVDIRMRELSWRRQLTDTEQAELNAWLATHPEARLEWANEAELSALLNRLPEVRVASNFTARVLQALDRETALVPVARSKSAWFWHAFLPRAAVAAVLLIGGVIAFEHHQITQRQKMGQGLAALSNVESLANPAMLQDFDAIRRLTPAATPDKELLALFQ